MGKSCPGRFADSTQLRSCGSCVSLRALVSLIPPPFGKASSAYFESRGPGWPPASKGLARHRGANGVDLRGTNAARRCSQHDPRSMLHPYDRMQLETLPTHASVEVL